MAISNVEQAKGVEPSLPVWETGVMTVIRRLRQVGSLPEHHEALHASVPHRNLPTYVC